MKPLVDHRAAIAQLERELQAHEADVVRRWPKMFKNQVDEAYRKAEEIKRRIAAHRGAITRTNKVA